MRRTSLFFFFFIALVFSASAVFAGSTGKIAGKVVEKSTGETLPGANVVIEGTTLGAVTDPDGNYFIINVPPGSYTVNASMVGYHKATQTNVRVFIDLTTTVNFSGEFGLVEETIQLAEITVVAELPVVQPDISANVANISAQDVESLPLTSVNEVVQLEAGVLAARNGDLSIRGSDLNEIAFSVDGLSMRDGRENEPYSTVSYTSIKEMSVQSGGFNAEYGNVRSGLVNIVTKEGDKQRYNGDVLLRYSGAQRDYFGPLPNHPNGYFWRPFTDPAVKNVGSHSPESPWDVYTRRQYGHWPGWNTIVRNWANAPTDPYHGVGVRDTGVDESTLPVEELQVDDAVITELFEWYRRKDLEVHNADFDIDLGFGGPLIPGLSEKLGGLRFFASGKRERRAYMMPRNIDEYENDWGRVKVTSDIRSSMKLSVEAMAGEEYGLNPNRTGFPGMWRGNQEMGLNDHDLIWANHHHNILQIKRNNVGLSFSHVLSPRTFYEFRFQRMQSNYLTEKYPDRDLTAVEKTIPRNSDFAPPNPSLQVSEVTQNHIGLTAAPDGYFMKNEAFVDGLYLGGHWANGRDDSEVVAYTTRFDITSQRSQVAQFKAGFEWITSDYDVNHENAQPFFKNNAAPKYIWQRTPNQFAAYVQTKLEFNAMIANLGVRWDLWNGSGEWWVYENFSGAFGAKIGKENLAEALDQAPVKTLSYFSPRLGISFPVTADSKLFFNYGHFRQMLNPHNLFLVDEINTGAVSRIGNPNHPMPRTINYELGFEQNLFDRYLLRLTGYYKANDDQTNDVSYTNLDQTVSYRLFEPLNYDDIRGFEITVRKRRGKWFGGFVNYTYLQTKGGNFGRDEMYENRQTQATVDATSTRHYQSRPVSRPFGRLGLEFYTPRDFGPQISKFYPLSNWDMSFVGNWRSGQYSNWYGPEAGAIPGLTNNVQYTSIRNMDLRLTRQFAMMGVRAMFFLDVDNVFNLKRLNRSSADPRGSDRDWQFYMASLHLPEDTFGEFDPTYAFIPGNDSPGAFRDYGTEFVPIEIVNAASQLPENGLPGDAEITAGLPTGLESDRRVLWYVQETGQYHEYQNGNWAQANQDFVNEVLDNKLYIDMPNNDFIWFLNPRRVNLGLRFSF
ncbi:MAG: TonB-dependent receptor plug domain-containing protein [Gemmatimonadetes bacterium]|nr:TonB-dependent receptor plug domain-containing protein [Gemmatimonadota bacterium]MYK53130.1 TonB-dependent receptor plug domain-containing protein [Gemmatimonadota bacterium]